MARQGDDAGDVHQCEEYDRCKKYRPEAR
jgi:hypothetical protein